MQISHEKPPCYEEANKLFKLDELNLGTIFTYGDTLHNPSKVPLSQDLLVHEETHSIQQEHNETVAKLWWQRYLADPEFRLSQEIEAYGKQYAFLCRKTTDRNKRNDILRSIASQLASPMYGDIITHSEAMKRVRESALGVH